MDRKNGIDLFRFVGAFFIVCLHVKYETLDNDYVDSLRLLSRWAVPFFYITTGFFLGYKIKNNNLDFEQIQKNVTVLISILIISSFVYLPLDIIKGRIPNSISNILAGTYYHLWFIGSLLVGYIFIWYLFFIKKNNLLPCLSIGILFFALFTDSYDQLINKNIDFDLCRFLLSIPLMNVGIVLSKKESKINLFNNKLLIVLILTGIAIQFIEAEFFSKQFYYDKFLHQFLFGTIIISISLFILSTKINIKENLLSKFGREHSLFIYLYHPLILIVIEATLTIIPNYTNFIRLIVPLIGFTLTLVFSVILSKYFPKIYNILNGKTQK